MADSSLNFHTMMRDVSHTQVHQQHRLQLAPQTFLVLGQGELFRHVNPDNFMWSDEGDRHLKVFIPFAKIMQRSPFVQVNLAGLDSSHAQNLRLKLKVSDTSTEGFVITAHTWQDTKIAGVDVSWMAIEHAANTKAVAAVQTLGPSRLS